MADVHIDPAAFRRRLHLLQKNISSSEYFKSVNGVLVVVGSSDDSNPYQKSTILQSWLLGYEFPATAFYITPKKITILTSAGKAKHLLPLVNNNATNIQLLSRTKDTEHNAKLFDEFIDVISKSGSGEDSPIKVGILTKDKYGGKFIDEWSPKWEASKNNFELTDISIGISASLEIKDEEEQKSLRVASRASVNFMTYFADEMSRIIDEELNTTNLALSDQIEGKIEDASFYKKFETSKDMKKLGNDFNSDNIDWCYRPIIQSGVGNHELKFSIESSKKKISGPVILSSLGLRYKSYCSNVSRTYLINPSKDMEKNYDFLLQVQSKVFSLLKDGAVVKDVYNQTVEYISSQRPDLSEYFIKNMGTLIGLDFRDSQDIINAKNERKVNEDSVFNLVLGFQNLEDKELGNYSLMLADTIRVTGGEPILLTDSPKLRKEISFYFDDKVKETKSPQKKQTKDKDTTKVKSEKKADPNVSLKVSSGVNTRVLKAKQRTEGKNSEEDQTQIQKELQKELHAKRQKAGLDRFNPEDAKDGSENKAVFKKYESYVRDTQIPNNVKDLKIHLDSKNQTIILPICGRPVPFHINSYKNGSKIEEGEYTHLRLNFNSPGITAVNTGISNGAPLPYELGADKQFIRSLTFRSKDGDRMSEVLKKITEMKKDAVKRESERKEKADIVTQANLIEINRPKRLDDVFIKPTPETKRLPGSLTIHQNGIRYQSLIRSDQKVDVLFSNIKHLFFQPCKGELAVIIHCHLKNPIMIGKRKTSDVQFYREAIDMSVDETGNRKRKYRYGDEDELEQEQEERRRKVLLDKEFKAFAEQIADASNGLVDLDIPFKELGFQGVHSRSAVQCLPTRDCLIQLIDTPFLVITLDEIEIAHLERVRFGLKNFDLVFVFKDFSRPVVQISTIPMESLEDVKAWLTDVDIPISEGTVNLTWSTIMKTIQADPYQFFVDGGWSFLTGGSDDEEEISEEEESEFEVSDDDPSDEPVESEDDYSESDESAEPSEEEDSDIANSDDDMSEDFSD